MSIPKTIMAEKDQLNDTNACGLIAIAIATNKTFGEVHAIFKRLGRRNKQGVTTWQMKKVLNILGFEIEELDKWKGKTCTTLTLPRKDNYIALTASHALAVKFGLIKDWTDGRRHRIQQVWKVVAR
jgi:hypothetical protein